MTAITWKGVTGSWGTSFDWLPNTVPTAIDIATIGGATGVTLTVDAAAAVQNIGFSSAIGSNPTLDIASSLSVSGMINVTAGTLILAAGGVLTGGTMETPGAGGTIVASGGTADNVVWLAPLGNGLAIDAATALDTTLSRPGPLAVVGALTLTSGSYMAALSLDSFGTSVPPSLIVADGNSVTLNSTLTLTCADPGSQPAGLPGPSGILIGGTGVLVNTGLIEVGLPGGAYGSLTLAAPMRNDGVIALDPVMVTGYQQTFHVPGHGKVAPSEVTLVWNYTLPDRVVIAAPAFTNTNEIDGFGTIVVGGSGATPTTFTNSGNITLSTISTQQPDLSGAIPMVKTQNLLSTIEIGSGVRFTNTGLIVADAIVFDGNVGLASLGDLHGSITFGGTLDLGGGTLDATATPLNVYTVVNAVKNGTLIGTASELHLGQATLTNVLAVTAATDILHDSVTGPVTLDATTLELRYQTAATTTAIAITATGPADFIAATAAGILTFDAKSTITNVTAGSTLTLGGPGIVDLEGTVTLAGATLVSNTMTGSGVVSLDGDASLTIGALAHNSQLTIDFRGGHNTLILPSSLETGALGLVLEGLASGDLIDFSAVSSAPGTIFAQPGVGIQASVLRLTGASGEQASVGVAGPTSALTFTVGPDGGGGSLVTVACFRHGTGIATPADDRPVETLRIGDLVDTPNGPRAIRWLGHRAYPASLVARQRQLRPVRIRAGALGHNLPTRDLDLSPLHAVLIDGALVPAAALVDGRTIVRAPIADTAYVHIELAEPGIVFAEGAAAETFVDCDSRAMFENAATYAALYPGAVSRAWRFAAPRVEGGWRLAAIRARMRPASPGSPHPLRGALDSCTDGILEGWAADGGGPVELEIVVGGRQVGCVVANRYRIDLDHAGMPEPAAGFRARLPAIPPDALAGLTVHRLSDGASLAR